MFELFKNFIIYGLGGILSKVVILLMIPIYTNHLTVEEYGYYDLVFSITSIAMVFGLMQLDTGFQRFYYEKDTIEYHKRLLSSTLFSITLFSLVVVTILTILNDYLSTCLFSGKYKLELYIASISVIIQNYYSYLLCILRYDDKPQLYAILSILSALLNASLSIILVVVYKLNVLGAILGDIIAHAIIVIIILVYEKEKIAIIFDRKLMVNVAKFSFPQIPARIGGVANTYINRFFMISLFSAEAIGLYSLGLKIASGIFLIQSAFVLAWNPYLYKILLKEDHKQIIANVARIATTLMCSIPIILTIYSRDIVLLVSNKTYLDAAGLIGILSLYNGIFLMKETIDIGVKVSRKSIYTSYIYILSLIINILLLMLLPNILGLQGVALSLLISNITMYIMTLAISQKLYKIPHNPLYFITHLLVSISMIILFNSLLLRLPIKIIISSILCLIIGLELKPYINKVHIFIKS